MLISKRTNLATNVALNAVTQHKCSPMQTVHTKFILCDLMEIFLHVAH